MKTKIEHSNTEYGKFKFNAQRVQDSHRKQVSVGTNGKQQMEGAEIDQARQMGDEGRTTVDEVYNELIHMRKMNRVLGQRIKQLEVQNFHMTAQGFN